MRFSTILIVLGILGLGVFIAVFDRGDERTTTGFREDARQRLFSDLGRLTGIRLEKDGVVCDLDWADDQWVFRDPAGAPARGGAVQRIVDALRAVESGAVLTEEELEARSMTLAELGLEPPAARIDFRTTPEPHTLWIGDRTAFESTLYARDSRSGGIVTLDARILDVFPSDRTALRDTGLQIPEPQALQRVEIERAAGFVQLVRGEDGRWGMAQPQELRVDQRRVESIMRALAALRMEAIVADSPEEGAAHGLAEPVAAVRWWRPEALNPDGLLVGAEVPGPEDGPDAPRLRYARLTRYPTVFTLQAEVADLLATPLNELRDRRVLPIEPADVTAIRIRDGEDVLVLGRVEEGWQLVEPESAPADGAQVEALLVEWCAARALRFPPADLAESIRTNAAAYRLEFLLEEPRVQQVDLYRHPDPAAVWVHLPREDTFAEVPAQLKAALSLNPLRFQDRAMIKVAPTDVLRVTVERDGDTTHVLRGDETEEWTVEGQTCVLNDKAFGELLERVCRLEARRLISADPADFGSFGLDEPAARVTLGLRSGGVISKTLVLGAAPPAGGGRYGTIRGQDLVFEVDAATSAVLLRPFCVKLE